jgi:hypothetical protein
LNAEDPEDDSKISRDSTDFDNELEAEDHLKINVEQESFGIDSLDQLSTKEYCVINDHFVLY